MSTGKIANRRKTQENIRKTKENQRKLRKKQRQLRKLVIPQAFLRFFVHFSWFNLRIEKALFKGFLVFQVFSGAQIDIQWPYIAMKQLGHPTKT